MDSRDDTPYLFLSYSRADTPLLERVSRALTERGWRTWLDRKSIPSAADWMAEIRSGIEGAAGFVFVITPHSIASRMCRVELSIAVEFGKRLLPLWPLDPAAWDLERSRVRVDETADADAQVPPELQRLDYIDIADFADRPDPFAALMDELVVAASRDLEWLRRHGRLQQDTKRWVDARHATSVLLRGPPLLEAERMLAQAQSKDPPLTPLQREFVATSRAELQRSLEREASQLASRILALPDERIAVGIMLAIEGRETYLPTPRLEGALRTLLSRWPQRALLPHSATITCAAFSADGARFATGSADGVVRAFDTKTAEPAGAWRFAAAVRRLVFALDGQRLFAACDDGRLGIADVGTATSGYRELFEEPIVDLALSPDGRRLALASGTTPVVIDLTTDTRYGLLPHPDRMRTVCWRSDEQIVTTCGDGFVRLLDLQGHWDELGLSDRLIQDVVVDPATRTLVVAGDFPGAVVIDPDTRQQLRALQGPDGTALSLTISRNGARVALQDVFGNVYAYDGATGLLLLRQVMFRQLARHLALSADGTLLGVASNRGPACVIDIDAQRQQMLAGHDRGLTAIAFDAAARTVLTASEDRCARLWTVGTAPGRHCIRLHDTIVDTDVSHDGSRIAVAARSGTARVFERAGSAPLVERGGPKDELRCATFTCDDKAVVLAYADGQVVFIDAANGTGLRSLKATAFESSERVKQSPDGRWLVVSRFDKLERVLDAQSGKAAEGLSDDELRQIDDQWARQAGLLTDAGRITLPEDDGPPTPFVQHGDRQVRLRSPEQLYRARFAPSGAVVAGAGGDSDDIHIFDRTTGERLAALSMAHPANEVRFSGNGEWIVASWLESLTVMHHPAADELVRLAKRQLHRGLNDHERAEFEWPRAASDEPS